MKAPSYLINDSYSCFVEQCWIRIEEEDIDLNVLQNFDVFYWLMATFLLVFGLPLNLSIIHYERFGGDSQKRSLGNRFSSYAVAFSMAASFSLLSFVGLIRWMWIIYNTECKCPCLNNFFFPQGTTLAQLNCRPFSTNCSLEAATLCFGIFKQSCFFASSK